MDISEEDYQKAVAVVRKCLSGSVSNLQRKLYWGYGRAASAIDRMQDEFIVSPMSASGRRDVYPEETHELWKELQAAKAQAVPEPTLDAPARVGGGIFQKGIKWSTVIGAAQRHYEHELREPIKPIISPADMLRIATGELVLVPIDTLKECLSWANVAKWDSPSKEVDREIAHHEGIIGAIIEAQEST